MDNGMGWGKGNWWFQNLIISYKFLNCCGDFSFFYIYILYQKCNERLKFFFQVRGWYGYRERYLSNEI